MKIVLPHLLIPILFSVAVTLYGITKNIFSVSEILVALFGGILFYSAPYLICVLIHSLSKPKSSVIHAGYIGATFSLFIIASFWFLPPDRSGLPLQWAAYWPLALLLIVFFVGISHFFTKNKSS